MTFSGDRTHATDHPNSTTTDNAEPLPPEDLQWALDRLTLILRAQPDPGESPEELAVRVQAALGTLLPECRARIDEGSKMINTAIAAAALVTNGHERFAGAAIALDGITGALRSMVPDIDRVQVRARDTDKGSR